MPCPLRVSDFDDQLRHVRDERRRQHVPLELRGYRATVRGMMCADQRGTVKGR